MELNYIWVESYKIIEKTGFNFSNSRGLRFTYDGKSLTPQFGPTPILDFGPAIKSVTAIAGQNGSGKSSLCEIIIHAVATMVNGSMGYSLRFKGIVSLGNRILKHQSIVFINQSELVRLGFEIFDYEDSPLEVFFPRKEDDLLDLGFIYYSNVIDWRGAMDEPNLVNISTINMILNDIYSSPYFYFTGRHHLAGEDWYRAYDQKTSVQAFHREENHRFTKFLIKHPELVPFKQPEAFEISISHSDENRWLNLHGLDYKASLPYSDVQNIIRNAIFSFSEPSEPDTVKSLTREEFIRYAMQLYRLNITQFFTAQKQITLDEAALYDFVFYQKMHQSLAGYVEQIEKLLSLFLKLISRGEFELNFKPHSASYFYPGAGDWRLNFIQQFGIKNTKENINLLKEFISVEEELAQDQNKNRLRISSCIIFPYPSAGENSFLSLFSRLYDTISKYVNGYDGKKNIVLFIDEGDMAFHPDWKKKLLYWLKDFLNKEFNPFQFQLILTSHSPYLLSDLHTENLILLRKGKKGRTEIIKSDSNRTFSANIHELLADSFFMKDGFIGAYAKDLLEKLVQYLTQEYLETQQWNKRKAKRIIAIVGDDIIRTRLEDLYTEKFGEPFESLKDEQTRLMFRLKEIEKELGDD